MQKNCLECQIDVSEKGKAVRGYCMKCYARLLGRGELQRLSGKGYCKECKKELVKGQQNSGRCLPCNRKYRNIRNEKIKNGELHNECKVCGQKLNRLSAYGFCVECKTKKVLTKTYSHEFYRRIKILCVKYREGMLRPDEILEALSLWCDCCDVEKNRNIDTLPVTEQIKYIFAQFNTLIKQKFNI